MICAPVHTEELSTGRGTSYLLSGVDEATVTRCDPYDAGPPGDRKWGRGDGDDFCSRDSCLRNQAATGLLLGRGWPVISPEPGMAPSLALRSASPGVRARVLAMLQSRGELLVDPVALLRHLVTQDPAFGDLILRAYLLRRSLLIELETGFRIVGSRFLPDPRRLREIAIRNRLPHQFIDLEQDKEAEALLRRLGVGPEETPVVIWGDHVMRNPTNAEFAHLLGLRRPAPGD